MPVPAGTGMDRRRFLLGAAGGLLSVYGARAARADQPCARRRDRAGGRGGTRVSPVLVSVFLAGGIDALSVLAPVDDRSYRKLRPTLAVAAGSPARRSGEDPRLHWHPSAASFAQAPRRRQDDRVPGHRLHEPGHVALHLPSLLGGRRDRDPRSSPAGSAATSTSSAARRIRSRDCRWTAQMNPTLATARNPVAAIQKPEDFSLWLEGVWGDIFNYTLDSASGARATPSVARRTRRSPRSPRRPPRSASCAARSPRSATRTATPPTTARSSTRRRRTPISPAGSPGSRR